MAVVPTMMVLYTNDAVDVRYSDGSLLQLSPCGSSMYHQDPPSDMPRHPLAGAQGVKKWTQFVTSTHKAKVLQAVDFRNRFACRPFLCPSLMAAEDIVSLYARIDQIAWGRTAEDCHIEVFEDGSRRAVSRDEYASLVLSPHGQDFTVCYLSRISPDSVTSNSPQPSHSLSQQDHSGGTVLSHPDSSHPFPKTDHEESEEKRPDQTAPLVSNSAGDHKATSPSSCPGLGNDAVLNQNCNNNSTLVNDIPVSGEATMDASGLILSEGTLSTPGRSAQPVDAQSSVFSLQQDISSISRVSTPDGLRGMVECDDTLPLTEDAAKTSSPRSAADVLHSSPLNLVNTVSCTGKGDGAREAVGGAELNSALKEAEAAAQKCTSQSGELTKQTERGVPAGRDEDCVSDQCYAATESRDMCSSTSTRSMNLKQTQASHSGKISAPEQQACQHQSTTDNTQHTHPPCRDDKTTACHDKVHRRGGARSQERPPTGGGVGGAAVSEAWSGRGRQHYSWVTRHVSCNSCPPAWRHPLRLLQQTDPACSILASECNVTVATNIAKGLRKSDAGDTSKCVLSPVVSPVPLTCPFQHQHQWQNPHEGDDDDDSSSAEFISPFKQGQLKVLMMEGVVYRFVDVANMKVVEIYPGDGSVLISQGTTARFFSHLVWKDGKLEEKTYSVKALPPKSSSAPYSVQHLIKRGHRLLTGCVHNSPLSQREALPCWKQAVTQVVEPLSSSLLEERTVAAYGRFQAYSNSRVRVLFEDRTALDMVADFSQRLHDCVKHSSVGEMSMEEKLAAVKLTSGDRQLQSSQCRLLLPSGKYVMVELHKPGPYRRYVDAAKEWIQWVQSSPKERRQFYQDKATPHSARLSAEVELKKIECFNYIADHSAIPKSSLPTTLPHPTSSLPASALQPSSSHSTVYGASSHQPFPHLPPPPPISQRPTSYQSGPPLSHSLGCGHVEGTSDFSSGGQSSTWEPRHVAMVQGFQSVKEALLRTSQMIKEIDDIVKDCKESGSGHSVCDRTGWSS